MPRLLARSAITVLLAATAFLVIACGRGGAKPVRGCQVDPDCGGVGRCVAGLCQASAPPVADFTVPPIPTTQRELPLASTSHDPDPGDAVVGWDWTVTRAGAACDPELTGADTATPTVVFWCPGTYRIGLAVTDSTGVESAPAERTVEVVPTTSAPQVVIAGASLVHHRCSGEPLRCALESPLALTVQAHPVNGGLVTCRWTVAQPDAGRAGASAAFAPSDTAPTAALQLGVAGTGITGTWTAQVRVRDSEGNLAVAAHAFEVGNRPPVLRAAGGSGPAEIALDHTVGDCPTGSGRCYQASGADAFVAEDPDGDPLGAVLIAADATGAGSGSVAEVGVGGRPGAFRFSTPLGNPSGFRAADGASGFHVKGTVTDVHGAAGSLTLTARIGNRPPVPTWGPATVTTPHAYRASAKAYQAGAAVAAFADPDGDPVVEAASTGDAVCSGFTATDGVVSTACLLAYSPVPGQVPPLATFVAPHTVTARVTDGWASASSRTVVAIENRPPVVPAYSGPAEGCACACNKWASHAEPGSPPDCVGAALASGGPVTSYPVVASDPDGDPLDLTTTYAFNSAAVTAGDGAASSSATWYATSIVCSSQGEACLP